MSLWGTCACGSGVTRTGNCACPCLPSARGAGVKTETHLERCHSPSCFLTTFSNGHGKPSHETMSELLSCHRPPIKPSGGKKNVFMVSAST